MTQVLEKRPLTDRVAVRNVLVSVSDKDGLEALLRALDTVGEPITLYSTGGTHKAIECWLRDGDYRLDLQSIEAYTGYPEMPGGLVKTLHPRVHGGLLAEPWDVAQAAHMAQQGMVPFDLVVVNLYPFERTVATGRPTLEAARSQIDIGGPTMIRAAAKNFPRVAVVVDPADYGWLGRELASHAGTLGFDTRWRLAQKAFERIADYDRAIAHYLGGVDARAALGTYDVH